MNRARVLAPAADWSRVQQLRQAVRDAPTVPARIQALCAYQGALHLFIDRYHHILDRALAAIASNDP